MSQAAGEFVDLAVAAEMRLVLWFTEQKLEGTSHFSPDPAKEPRYPTPVVRLIEVADQGQLLVQRERVTGQNVGFGRWLRRRGNDGFHDRRRLSGWGGAG